MNRSIPVHVTSAIQPDLIAEGKETWPLEDQCSHCSKRVTLAKL